MNTRQSAIVTLLREQPRLQVRELAAHFGVSEMTIRRDMIRLESDGVLVRTYGGGAALHPPLLAPEATRQPVDPAKAAIGRLAASLVTPGQTIMVDTGTSALEVARHLPLDPSITVATTSLPIAQELASSPLNILLLGGFVHKEMHSLYGPLTEHMLHILHVDTLFIGCNGADSTTGFYANDLLLFSQVQAMVRSANRIVVVTESDKFGRKAFVRYAGLDEIHTLVTDSGLPAQDRQNLEERGVTVLIANA